MSILDKVVASGKVSDDDDYNLEDDVWGAELPGLFEFLARVRYNGANRSPGRLVIYTERGKACVCLCDKHTSQVCFYVSDGVQQCLEGLERQLQAGKCDWRVDRRSKGLR